MFSAGRKVKISATFRSYNLHNLEILQNCKRRKAPAKNNDFSLQSLLLSSSSLVYISFLMLLTFVIVTNNLFDLSQSEFCKKIASFENQLYGNLSLLLNCANNFCRRFPPFLPS